MSDLPRTNLPSDRIAPPTPDPSVRSTTCSLSTRNAPARLAHEGRLGVVVRPDRKSGPRRPLDPPVQSLALEKPERAGKNPHPRCTGIDDSLASNSDTGDSAAGRHAGRRLGYERSHCPPERVEASVGTRDRAASEDSAEVVDQPCLDPGTADINPDHPFLFPAHICIVLLRARAEITSHSGARIRGHFEPRFLLAAQPGTFRIAPLRAAAAECELISARTLPQRREKF